MKAGTHAETAPAQLTVLEMIKSRADSLRKLMYKRKSKRV